MPLGCLENSRTLLVRHLPSCLSSKEKEELLKYFGAFEVRVMPKHGRLKHTAFATFEDHINARKAIDRLHQVEILDCVLSVEFAKEQQIRLADKEQTVVAETEDLQEKDQCDDTGKSSLSEIKSTNYYNDILPPIAPHFGLKYPANPGLKYKYPSPNADILINICSAFLTVPRLYTQTLHLMNKMNLVPPFNPATTVPPMLVEHIQKLCNLSYNVLGNKQSNNTDIPTEPDKLDVVEMSESESEYESGEDNDDKTVSLNMNVPERVLKARKRRKEKSLKVGERKRRKLKNLITDNTTLKSSTLVETVDRSIAFEESTVDMIKKPIDIKLPSALDISTQVQESKKDDLPETELAVGVDHASELNDTQTEGFGRLLPVKSTGEDDDNTADNTTETVIKDYITEQQLESGKLSKKEMSNSSLYDKYQKGEPTSRLYIKNLSKQVTEKDLKFIFGRFVNFNDENESNMFDVRLMTQGRMKGQAFIGMPNIEAATRALRATNGYQLINKPMVVHFARSAKPK
ncbi:RNA-binding region-containing protein 3-like [Styela clava]